MATIEIELDEEYNIRFDENQNHNWSPRAEYNLAFIRATTSFLQDKLNRRGYLFVNEVLEAFGYDARRPSGQVMGWIRRDGYLIVEAEMEAGDAGVIWIKFAPQGVIVNELD